MEYGFLCFVFVPKAGACQWHNSCFTKLAERAASVLVIRPSDFILSLKIPGKKRAMLEIGRNEHAFPLFPNKVSHLQKI